MTDRDLPGSHSEGAEFPATLVQFEGHGQHDAMRPTPELVRFTRSHKQLTLRARRERIEIVGPRRVRAEQSRYDQPGNSHDDANRRGFRARFNADALPIFLFKAGEIECAMPPLIDMWLGKPSLQQRKVGSFKGAE